MGRGRKYKRRDSNHKEVLRYLRSAFRYHNAEVLDIADYDLGCDILVLLDGKAFFVEVKSPESRPKNKSVLSLLIGNEPEMREKMIRAKVPYLIVFSGEEAYEAINKTRDTVANRIFGKS